jgi:hypothetical protein
MGRPPASSTPSAALAVALIVLAVGATSGPHSASLAGAPTAPSADCPGASFAPQYDAEFSVDGGPLPSNVTGDAELTLSFFVTAELVDEPSGDVVDSACEPVNETVTTNAVGGFAFGELPLRTSCQPIPNGTACTEYGNPAEPLTVSPAIPTPAGYALSFQTTPDRGDLSLVWELGNVSVDPGGPTLTVAPGAPTAIVASGWAANGSATPLDPTYSWNLSGTGWAFDQPPAGDRAVVVSVPGSAAGTLTVGAEARVNGTLLAPPPISIALDAVATAIAGAELNRTDLDVGSTLAANLTAVGASGYGYRAWFSPGLGLAPTAVPCTTAPDGPGTVLASCLANLTYTGAGIAQPTANVTNGYSTALWRFPNVTVDPPAALWVAPVAPAGYAGSPVAIDLVATNGSGTLPFATACLEPGLGPTACSDSSGPIWSFDPVYPAPGTYAALAWAIDSGGTNRSVAFNVTVVASLAVGPLDLATSNATVGVNVTIDASVAGGDLPARFWWNSSLASGSLRTGSLDGDGSISLAFVPSVAGPTTVTLTVRDALGTAESAELEVLVGPALAVRVAEIGSPPRSVVAGGSTNLSWQALDGSGGAVPSFASAAEITLEDAGGDAPRGSIDASAVGPLTSLGGGAFAVPSAAWVDGVLDVSVEVTTAGLFSVELEGAGLPSAVAPIDVQAIPDSSHLILYDPLVEVRGVRDNSTYWGASDRFGNPVPGANVSVRIVWGTSVLNETVPTVAQPNGTTGLWVNYSAPATEGGSVTVIDGAGEVVLGPIVVPAPSSAAPFATLPFDEVAGIVGAGAGGVALVAVALLRRQRSHRPDGADLQRLAEGRAALVELVRRSGPLDLAGVEGAWTPPPPPPDLADWLASLVADGTLGATVGDDGRARFCLAPGPSSPRVTLDPAAFDEGLRRRDLALDDAEPGP